MRSLTGLSRCSGGLVTGLLLVVASTAACGAAPGPAATGDSLAAVPQDLQVTRRTWGGRCPEGPCRSELVVESTGRWTLQTEAEYREGAFLPEDIGSLARAVQETRLDEATGRPTCAADFDGTAVEYVWRSAGETHSISSCDHPIDDGDPLAATLEELARRTDG